MLSNFVCNFAISVITFVVVCGHWPGEVPDVVKT